VVMILAKTEDIGYTSSINISYKNLLSA